MSFSKANAELVSKYRAGKLTPTGIDYENYIINELLAVGYKAKGTPVSGDQGVDIIMDLFPGARVIVQCKYYGRSVGNSCVQQIVAAKKLYRACHCIAVTNNKFTPEAVTLAKCNGVALVGGFDVGDDISRFVREAGLVPKALMSILAQYEGRARLLSQQVARLKGENERLEKEASGLRAEVLKKNKGLFRR